MRTKQPDHIVFARIRYLIFYSFSSFDSPVERSPVLQSGVQWRVWMTTRLNGYVKIEEWDRIKKWSGIGFTLNGLRWFWCRWRAGDLSFSTTPKSPPADKYKPESSPPFDSIPFLNFHIFIQTRGHSNAYWTLYMLIYDYFRQKIGKACHDAA